MSLNLANNIIINNINNIEYAIEHFDKIMAIHDIVGTYQNINIVANEYNKEISFDIIFKQITDAATFYSATQRKEVSKYGHIFIPLLNLNYNTINIKLIDRLNQIEVSG